MQLNLPWEPICTDLAVLCWIEAHPGLASWVQAVGSIAAIMAAVGVAWMSVREQRLQGWRVERGFLKEAVLALKWSILDAELWIAALRQGGVALEKRLSDAVDRDAGMDSQIAKLAFRSDTQCPDPQVKGSLSLLPEWRRDLVERAKGVLAGTVALDTKGTQLGALEMAEIHQEALRSVLQNALRALKSVS